MKKITIIINGKGGAGKDTMCEMAAKHFRTMNVSSIDPIKRIASQNGWNGEKDDKSRKFLADLKKIFTDYNDLPTEYIFGKYKEFLVSDCEILFVHIREPEEIEKFRRKIEKSGGVCKTLLVTSERCKDAYGNASDDGTDNYPYDFIYRNDSSLDTAESEFTDLIGKILCGRDDLS